MSTQKKKGVTFKSVNIKARQKANNYNSLLKAITELKVLKVIRVYTLDINEKVQGRFSGIKGYRFLEIESATGERLDRIGYNLFAKLALQSGVDIQIESSQEEHFDIALQSALGDAFDRQEKMLASKKS